MKNLDRYRLSLWDIFLFPNDPLKYFRRGFAQFGDTYKMGLFKDFLISRHPDVFKHTLVSNQKNYHKGEAATNLALVLGNGLLTSEGDFWLRQRRLAQPAFHKEKLNALFVSMGEITQKFLQDLEKERGEIINLDEKMMALTADIALKTLFSTITKEDKVEIYNQINIAQTHIITRLRRPYMIPFLGITGANRKFNKSLTLFNTFVLDLIHERRQSTEPQQDLLQLFMDAQDADTGEKMEDKHIRDEVMTMFGAGHETSANALDWIIFELAQHPEIKQKIRKEAEVFEDVPKFDQLLLMPYTKQVIAEGLRLYPPAWATVRVPYANDSIEGIKIEKGQTVFLSIFELHRNPNFWTNPEVFNPENFSKENTQNHHKYQYLPFGAGARLCIGQQFALMEMQLILSALLKKFDFQKIENYSPKMFPLITLKPIDGLKMRLA
jgi:cytochrome P450